MARRGARSARHANALSTSIPPPVGGWNTKDSLADMELQYAVVLDNWFPEDDKITLRQGHASHATGMTGNIDTLLEYTTTAGADKLFACDTDGDIYEVTSAGAVGAAVVTGMTGIQWQHQQIGTAGGNFLIAVNGLDTPREYDGASWTTASITGPTATDLIWINLHQRRLFFGEKNSLSFWYLDVNSKSGAATEFSLAGVARLGGYLMAMGTWTRDAGDGADDVAVFLTSEGEAIIYQGTDPSSETTWGLVGVFRVGSPIGRRCFTKAGGDLIFITQDGFVSANRTIASGRPAISEQINSALNKAVRSNGANFGWQPIIYPSGNMLIFNVPQGGTMAHQYVFNTITNAPCRFTGLNARCWGMLNDELYFGGMDGTVYKFDTTNADAGSNIVGDALQAFSYFGTPGRIKAFKLAEAVFLSTGPPSYGIGLNYDFKQNALQESDIAGGDTTGFAVWDTAKWDEANWGGDGQLFRSWRGVTGHGTSAGIRLRTDTKTSRPSWMATNLIYQLGGAI